MKQPKYKIGQLVFFIGGHETPITNGIVESVEIKSDGVIYTIRFFSCEFDIETDRVNEKLVFKSFKKALKYYIKDIKQSVFFIEKELSSQMNEIPPFQSRGSWYQISKDLL